jgi:hypothetical protein
VLESAGGQDLTTAAITAGTPAGAVSAPIFTGTPAAPTGAMSHVAADPASGEVHYYRIMLKNSIV